MTASVLARVRDPGQFIAVAVMLTLGVALIVDASGLRPVVGSNDPLGPKPVPIVVGVAAILVAVFYAFDVLRGGVGEAEAGEDVDEKSRTDFKTVGLLAGAFVVNALLIEPLGWVISSTILFWLSAFALGNRHHLRALIIAVALALITFYAFAVGLGVNLPAGILQGLL